MSKRTVNTLTVIFFALAFIYKMTLKLGQVYQNTMIDSDPGAFNLAVKNGKQTFFLAFGDIAEDYVNSVTGYEPVTARYSKMATDYIQGLY